MRTLLAVLLGKLIYFLTRTLKIGGGAAAPGYYALKLDPNLVKNLASQISQQVIITGTNGKTTTSRLLDHFVKSQNLKTLRNSTGSNLERGIASALIEKANFFGQIKNIDLAIWEADEAAFNKVLFQIKPQVIVFLNAFRDQLDRYGEVDSVVKKWLEALERVDWATHIFTCGNDQNTLKLKKVKADLSVFSIPELGFLGEGVTEPKETLVKTDFEAKIEQNRGLKGQLVKVNFPGKSIKLDFKIAGIYHVFDLLAALSVYYSLNLPTDQLQETLDKFSPAFGRLEKIKLGNKEGLIFLIKNPVGASLVLETIYPEIKAEDTLLLALNDNFADGTDVSWIWDVNFEQLAISNEQLIITCSGTRAYDMALRLKYAGVETKQIQVEPALEKALVSAERQSKNRIFILPTYTALLELQKLLTKKGVKKHYWRE